MFRRLLISVGALVAVVALAVVFAQEKKEPEKVDLPQMKFDDVKEIAPGVFFRYSSISATDKTVPFGGSNNTWVVFKDYVIVIDANFPKEADDVLAAIKKTTDKPVKYVFDTHHHGDHAWGNTVWAKAGAKVIGSKDCARLLKTSGPKDWKAEQDKVDGRADIKKNELKLVDQDFSDTLALDDGTQRVEFHFLGHAHTPGDAVAYLPKHKILCTGDMCVNGAFNYTGHADTASWIKVLQKAEKFDVKLVCPGHGPVADKDVLAKQRRWFEDLRAAVKQGIDDKKELKDITAGLRFEWYEKWTGVPAKSRDENIEHVYKELTGKIDHSKLGL
ncbi:MAG: MBL fold metallo-hydrolase [Fimbriiglobus sp.]|jgi:glyoxylase-like metal-dependent hydrolase (beta-lactamase superfamily II)|nr:MBL fold metallo-hydrolase [Fimbriiglobus sp.]